MSVDKSFTLFGIDVTAKDTPASDQLITGITDYKYNTGFEEILLTSDGMVNPTFTAAGSIAPVLNFTTLQIAAVLAKTGLCGTAILGSTGIIAFFQQLDDLAKRLGTLKHTKMQVLKGILVPRTLTAPHDADATIVYDVIALFDGTNDPVIISKNQTLTAGTFGIDEVFRAGPVEINGTQIKGITNIEIDFGITLETLGSDGEVFPRFSAIMTQKPKITFTTKDADQINDIGLSGAAQGATDSLFYLRKIAQDGTRVPDVTAEHIKFTMDEGMFKIVDAGNAIEASTDTGIEATPTFDGSNDILVVDTSSAIT